MENRTVSFSGRWRVICLVMISLGFVTSGYLLARTFALIQDQPLDVIDVCAVVFGSGCDETLLSASSWQLGIPLAGWGVVYYGTLGCLVLMAWILGEEFRREATIGAWLLALVGFCISVLLSVTIATGSAPLCGLCLFVHAVNVALVPSLKYLTGSRLRDITCALRAAGNYLVGGKIDQPRAAHWKAVGFVTVGLVATVLYQWMLVEAERRLASSYAAIDDLVLAKFERSSRQEVPVNRQDARLGPATAPAQLVVFSSFQCSGCKAIVGELYRLHDRYPDQLAIVFKHFPLGKACNDAVQADMQPQACATAWAAVSAHQQNQFWAFHDAAFESDLSAGEETLVQIAARLGLDESQFEHHRSASRTKAQVRTDVELGTRLGVDATPALFLNGRRVRHVSARSLGLLVRSELEENALSRGSIP